MPKRKDPDQDEAIRKRIAIIRSFSGLEIPGFAEYVGISQSQVYAILNGHRPLSKEMAHRIAKGFKLTVAQIFDLNYEIPKSIRSTPALRDFMVRERDIPEYFQHTQEARKSSYYVEHKLIYAEVFKEDTPAYLWQVREFCFSEEKYYSSDQLSKLLYEQVKKGNLIGDTRPILRRNGTYGIRIVNVYFRPPSSRR